MTNAAKEAVTLLQFQAVPAEPMAPIDAVHIDDRIDTFLRQLSTTATTGRELFQVVTAILRYGSGDKQGGRSL